MTDQMGTTLGQIIDGLGCEATISEGDLVADAVVVLKVVETDGSVRLSIGWSDNMSWIERLGMLRAAERMDLPQVADVEEEQ